MVGEFSVTHSFMRTYAFMWLSGTWCTTWRTVQPPGRYGVSSCGSRRPRTAARSAAGAAAMSAIRRPPGRRHVAAELEGADGIAKIGAHS
jgi:hypothetical protein